MPTNQPRQEQSLCLRLNLEAPPFIVYGMTRKSPHGKWIGVEELVRRSGLSKRTVIRLGMRTDWAGVKIGVASRFLAACGVKGSGRSILSMNRIREYLRWYREHGTTPCQHLTTSQWRRLNQLGARWGRELKRDSEQT